MGLSFEDKERATGLVPLVLCLVFTRPRQGFLSHWVFVLPVQRRYSLAKRKAMLGKTGAMFLGVV